LLAPGEKYKDVTCADHVWLVSAIIKTHTDSDGSEANRSSAYNGKANATSLLLRPSRASLQNGQCLSMIWVPLISLSVSTHKTLSRLPEHQRMKNMKRQMHVNENIQFHVQIFHKNSLKKSASINDDSS
jgi:hypothetical protein